VRPTAILKPSAYWRRSFGLRVTVGLTMLAVVMAGAWGGYSLLRSSRAGQRAATLRSAYDDLRYAAALEGSALPERSRRDTPSYGGVPPAVERARRALATLAANGSRQDEARIRRVTKLEASALAVSARLNADGRGGATATQLRRRLSQVLSEIEVEANRGSVDLRLRNAGQWPAAKADRVGLAGMTLLCLFGLGVVCLALGDLVGWRRRGERARRAELDRLEREALTDGLTGLRNRRAFQEDLKRELERRNRTGAGFAVVMVDMDGLKQINDTCGHQGGDERIKAVAECLKQTVRGSDLVYRVGGDEFMVLLPGERAWGALTHAQRLHGHADRAGVSVTAGIAESIGTESSETLIRQCDLALYEAKRLQRNTVVYTPGLEPLPGVTATQPDLHHQQLVATALARAVDAKGLSAPNHCETVSEICALIGRELGLDPQRLEQLRLAGLLHDVGKIGIADSILLKPATLGLEERAIVASHARIGHDILNGADLREEADWVLQHHERWDGAGYPAGLSGEAIPLESRVILVADAFEAITADRPYRAGRPPEEALEELVAHAGTQFDPSCVAALCAVFDHQPSVRIVGDDELSVRRNTRAEARPSGRDVDLAADVSVDDLRSKQT